MSSVTEDSFQLTRLEERGSLSCYTIILSQYEGGDLPSPLRFCLLAAIYRLHHLDSATQPATLTSTDSEDLWTDTVAIQITAVTRDIIRHGDAPRLAITGNLSFTL